MRVRKKTKPAIQMVSLDALLERGVQIDTKGRVYWPPKKKRR